MSADLEKAFADAASAWPGVSLDRAAFDGWMKGKEPSAARELYLACACAKGDANAIRAFEAQYFASAASVVGPNEPGALREELLQQLRQRLFLGTEQTGPKLAEYKGKGGLERWVRAVAARLALNLRRDRKDERYSELASDDLLGAPIGSEDPELSHMKGLYRGEFKQAFTDALGSLEPELRNFLRLYYLDGLGLAEIAAMYKFSVPTMSRRLSAAREAALEATRRLLQQRLSVSATDLESIMRLIQSRLTIAPLK